MRGFSKNPETYFIVLLQLKRRGVAKAKGEGEKEEECTTECKSRRQQDEKAPWALNYESGEGGPRTEQPRPRTEQPNTAPQ